MPMTMMAMGESEESPQAAFAIAMGTLSGPMHDAEQSLILAHDVERTPTGFRVIVRIVLLSAEDIRRLREQYEREADNDNEGPRDKVLVDESFDAVAAYAAMMHRVELESLAGQIEDMAAEPPPVTTDASLPEDFDHASQSHASDAAYLYNHTYENDNRSDYITTRIDNAEIASATVQELLASEDVRWRDPGPVIPPEAMPEGGFEKPSRPVPPGDAPPERNLVA